MGRNRGNRNWDCFWCHSGNRDVGQYGRDRGFERLRNFIKVSRKRGEVIRDSGCRRGRIRDSNCRRSRRDRYRRRRGDSSRKRGWGASPD